MKNKSEKEATKKSLITYNPRPTTPEEANFYEYLRHAHCHRCPDSEDCDVEDFLNCEVPVDLAVSWDKNAKRKFGKCSCFQCIDDKKLQQILQGYYSRVKKLYKTEEETPKKKEVKKTAEVKKITDAKGKRILPKKKPAQAPAKKTPAQQELFAKKK